MEVIECKENPDGSVNLEIELTPEESQLLIQLGLHYILLERLEVNEE